VGHDAAEARLLNGASEAGKGMRARCVGTWRSACLAIETDYVTFRRGELAALKDFMERQEVAKAQR
jgi:hypothetical protein